MSATHYLAVGFMGVALAGAGAGAASDQAATGARAAPPTTLSTLCGLPYARGTLVRFRAADNAPLVGAIAGSGQIGVAFANTSNGEICDWISGEYKLLNALIASGCRVLLFDYRGTGRSPSVAGKRAGAWDSDAMGAASELRALGARRVVLIGGSTGGIVVLAAAAKIRPAPAAIVALSASGDPGPTSTGPGKGRLDGKAAVRSLRIPVLFVAARDDGYGYPPTRLLFRLATEKDKQILVIPGQAHAFFDLDPSGPKVDARILTFIRGHTVR